MFGFCTSGAGGPHDGVRSHLPHLAHHSSDQSWALRTGTTLQRGTRLPWDPASRIAGP
jgi:hypothetical protein